TSSTLQTRAILSCQQRNRADRTVPRCSADKASAAVMASAISLIRYWCMGLGPRFGRSPIAPFWSDTRMSRFSANPKEGHQLQEIGGLEHLVAVAAGFIAPAQFSSDDDLLRA